MILVLHITITRETTLNTATVLLCTLQGVIQDFNV